MAGRPDCIEPGRPRPRLVARSHAHLCHLRPGGIARELNASDAETFLAELKPLAPAAQVRRGLAVELLADIKRSDTQLEEPHRRIGTEVNAAGTHP